MASPSRRHPSSLQSLLVPAVLASLILVAGAGDRNDKAGKNRDKSSNAWNDDDLVLNVQKSSPAFHTIDFFDPSAQPVSALNTVFSKQALQRGPDPSRPFADVSPTTEAMPDPEWGAVDVRKLTPRTQQPPTTSMIMSTRDRQIVQVERKDNNNEGDEEEDAPAIPEPDELRDHVTKMTTGVFSTIPLRGFFDTPQSQFKFCAKKFEIESITLSSDGNITIPISQLKLNGASCSVDQSKSPINDLHLSLSDPKNYRHYFTGEDLDPDREEHGDEPRPYFTWSGSMPLFVSCDGLDIPPGWIFFTDAEKGFLDIHKNLIMKDIEDYVKTSDRQDVGTEKAKPIEAKPIDGERFVQMVREFVYARRRSQVMYDRRGSIVGAETVRLFARTALKAWEYHFERMEAQWRKLFHSPTAIGAQAGKHNVAVRQDDSDMHSWPGERPSALYGRSLLSFFLPGVPEACSYAKKSTAEKMVEIMARKGKSAKDWAEKHEKNVNLTSICGCSKGNPLHIEIQPDLLRPKTGGSDEPEPIQRYLRPEAIRVRDKTCKAMYMGTVFDVLEPVYNNETLDKRKGFMAEAVVSKLEKESYGLLKDKSMTLYERAKPLAIAITVRRYATRVLLLEKGSMCGGKPVANETLLLVENVHLLYQFTKAKMPGNIPIQEIGGILDDVKDRSKYTIHYFRDFGTVGTNYTVCVYSSSEQTVQLLDRNCDGFKPLGSRRKGAGMFKDVTEDGRHSGKPGIRRGGDSDSAPQPSWRPGSNDRPDRPQASWSPGMSPHPNGPPHGSGSGSANGADKTGTNGRDRGTPLANGTEEPDDAPDATPSDDDDDNANSGSAPNGSPGASPGGTAGNATPTPTPTTSPATSPTSTVSPSPSPSVASGGNGACFPAAARVMRANGHLARMDELVVGDWVRDAHGNNTRIVLMAHARAHVPAAFVHLRAGDVADVMASAKHYLVVNGGGVRTAGSVRVGDSLQTLAAAVGANATTMAWLQGEPEREQVRGWGPRRVVSVNVTSVRHGVVRTGLYAPVTMSGSVAVWWRSAAPVAASSYTADADPRLAHGFLTGLRALHSLFGMTVAGLSTAMRDGAQFWATALRDGEAAIPAGWC